LKKTTFYERVLLLLGGLLLVYPVPLYDIAGLGLMAISVVSQKLRKTEVA